MTHPLLIQLRFARSEFQRGLADVQDPEAQQRFGSLNCLSWIVGHLAWQEQRYWLERAQGIILFPELNEKLAYGKPATLPPVEEMWQCWREITHASGPWLESLSPQTILEPLMEGMSSRGTFMLRVIYHYWYHLGEGMAVRQLLGHSNLPDFVGSLDSLAPYCALPGDRIVEEMPLDDFLRKLDEVSARWDALLSRFSPEQMLQPLDIGWPLKDIIAHLTWHEQEMLTLLRTRRLEGSPWWGLPLDQRNQLIYDQYAAEPLPAVLENAGKVSRLLRLEIQALTDEDWLQPERIELMPPDWRLSDLIMENTVLHYLDHIRSLESWLDRQ
jgi:hypothetical protein